MMILSTMDSNIAQAAYSSPSYISIDRSCFPVIPIDCNTANSYRLLIIPVMMLLKKLSIPTSPVITQSTPPSSVNIFLNPSNSALTVALLSYISDDAGLLVNSLRKASSPSSALRSGASNM